MTWWNDKLTWIDDVQMRLCGETVAVDGQNVTAIRSPVRTMATDADGVTVISDRVDWLLPKGTAVAPGSVISSGTEEYEVVDDPAAVAESGPETIRVMTVKR